jgi:broad specificity phosphatase PhoE
MSAMDRPLIYVVRHGETVWNREGRIQGAGDSPLTTTGLEQAAAVGAALRGRGIAAIVSSDQGRAEGTARLVNRALRRRVDLDPAWREMDYGVFGGQRIEDVPARLRPLFRRCRGARLRGTDRIPGAEPPAAFRRRVAAAWMAACKRRAGLDGDLLIVTHGAVLGELLRLVLGLPIGRPRRYALPNAAINVIAVDVRPGVVVQMGTPASPGSP